MFVTFSVIYSFSQVSATHNDAQGKQVEMDGNKFMEFKEAEEKTDKNVLNMLKYYKRGKSHTQTNDMSSLWIRLGGVPSIQHPLVALSLM